MPEKKVQCPHCSEIFQLDLPAVSADQLTKADLEEILKNTQTPGNLDHRHKTADDFFDCPECRLWFDKSAQRYQVTEKEPAPSPEKQAEKKEPESAATQAIGSIFKKGGEHE